MTREPMQLMVVVLDGERFKVVSDRKRGVLAIIREEDNYPILTNTQLGRRVVANWKRQRGRVT
jgi:hypothetical protein